jgi:hypothetical protein
LLARASQDWQTLVMSRCRQFCQSGLGVIAGLLLSVSPVRAEDAPWEVWIPASPAGHDQSALLQKFSSLNKEQRVTAALHLIQKWGSGAREEVFAVASACEIPLDECFENWARQDFEAALERAEQWDGFHGNWLRKSVILAVAKSDPVEAARRMRARFDPMSRSYYYYVMLYGLLPALKDQPARVILQALQEMRSDLFFMDEFRWGDAAYELAGTHDPWRPANPSRDWEYLISQPPSVARDLLLCVTLHVWLKRDLEKAITLDVPPLYADLVSHRLEHAFPEDFKRVPELLPVAKFELMRSWVRNAERKRLQPEWRQWASLSAYQPAPAARERALDTVMRLWLERDEVAVRAWMQDLPDGPARELAEAACVEAEINHLISEDWSRAFSLAKAMPEGARRLRCLKAVFAGAASGELAFVQREIASLSLPAEQQTQIRDAWRVSRSDYLQRLKTDQGHDPLRAFALILELEDVSMRRMLALERMSFMQRLSSEDVLEVIEKSSMPRQDKEKLLLQWTLLVIDGSPNGPDIATRLNLTTQIADDETRFVHQRAVIRQLVDDDPRRAQEILAGSVIKEADRQRLRKDLERASKWYRREKTKAAK